MSRKGQKIKPTTNRCKEQWAGSSIRENTVKQVRKVHKNCFYFNLIVFIIRFKNDKMIQKNLLKILKSISCL